LYQCAHDGERRILQPPRLRRNASGNGGRLCACIHEETDLEPTMTNEALARWNDRFSAPGYLFGTAPNRFLASQRDRLVRGQRALAVADGEGRNGVWLVQQGLRVTSIDFSPVALAKARALAKGAGVALDTIEVDLGAWTWPAAAYDVIVAIFCQF